jgi:hypothetical protein
MKIVNHEYGMAETDTEVISIEKGKVDPTEFDPPEGYRAISFNEFMSTQMSGEEEY